ncbi:hypothetical protein [Lewinella sp. W8]|uniref:hypothetical protein n=1 Tax=Lewinella sp. W8 TaxID=2528208 RepID=UPI0010674D39|nr:hypothetical protein [Lewinella sp. W8]MTB53058.1 hypothetical protein [Lewinella sp. W8]
MEVVNKERAGTEFSQIAKAVSAPFIEEMEKAASKWLDRNLEQFTIDLLEEWSEGIDINPSEHAGALSYQYDNIISIIDAELDDYDCVKELAAICGRWSKAVEAAWQYYQNA